MKKTILLSCFLAALALAGAEKRAAGAPAAAAEVPVLETGKPVPELSGAWTKGEPVKLAEQKNKNYVVLYFWAVNQQSLDDMPRMGETVKRFSGKPVVFVGVGCDKLKKVSEFFRAKELPMPVLADDQLAILRRYLRSGDRLPFASVVDREGRLAWRGAPAALPNALDRMLAGKFDMAEFGRREKFSAQVSDALSKNHYEEALKLIDGELKRHPGNVELVSTKVNILVRGLKQTADAVKAVDAGLKERPKELAFHELKLKLLRKYGKEADIEEFYDNLCKVFADQPLVLVRFSDIEVGRRRPELLYKIMKTAYSCPKFADDRERGIVALAYARTLYFCGRPEPAFKVSKLALALLKGKPEYESAKVQAEFLNRIAALAKKIGD